MNAIAVETSGTYLSFAILKNGRIAAKLFLDAGWNHENIFWRRFPPALKKTGLRLNNLDFLAATTGPGRFTGVRLGLSIINTWAGLHQTPVFAPSVGDLMAWSCGGPSRLLRVVAFSGAYVAAEESRLKAYPALEDLFAKKAPGKTVTALYYVQENLKEKTVALAKQFGFNPKEEIPSAERLLSMALAAAKTDRRWIKPPQLPKPIYLKNTWNAPTRRK
ncbi:MAG: tRNA (adenosine(37)-N6)-threonylcarbamoyltransferase complex dimerization subunit type 1 TsaB [Elusimicrobia bacterium]|nr:tRNA (adenosine(37)-N6)-threonylcarbamoyltransferase complex dimerization subunit type 1 TsaB [Elusimicrobiota bacterium]